MDLATARVTYKMSLDMGQHLANRGRGHLPAVTEPFGWDNEGCLQLVSRQVCSFGDVRLIVRWDQHVRRVHFVHLPSITVPVILEREFLVKTGLVIDIASAGYQENSGRSSTRWLQRNHS